ncbi:SRPBCC domain-containing protein [Streptomyces sp. RY43-2]|uniref:SRPBCC domain-containing protein n=1 Tax=Streptomyces macrolidinus TaxID=2952607 RepID=A0ABT0ZE29_9ACTN|nr:SRPBCC domain-containing protein [Streptomyces macrolidinus]MCN9241846.1 SRPBCC domain-containing protein [Streptomyces macrolidinus]
MEHEVFVPVPVERLGEALADPARVARAIPGFQQDAGKEPVAGRLKVRIGGHTITYRGALRVTGDGDGPYTLEGEATEARGTGTVKLSLSVRLLAAPDGTTVAFTAAATADGRIAELPGDTVTSAAARLLGRFAQRLGEGEATAASPKSAEQRAEPPAPSVFETEVPPSSLDPFADEDDSERRSDRRSARGFADEDEPPAEAAHARRTMIGRSAEEVDHAPPRGRYAPVPAPETVASTATLRWAAPAAALLVASAIVAGRLLRRRR